MRSPCSLSSRCALQHQSSPLASFQSDQGVPTTFVTRLGKSLRTRRSRPHSSTHKSTTGGRRNLRGRHAKCLQMAYELGNQPGSPEIAKRSPSRALSEGSSERIFSRIWPPSRSSSWAHADDEQATVTTPERSLTGVA